MDLGDFLGFEIKEDGSSWNCTDFWHFPLGVPFFFIDPRRESGCLLKMGDQKDVCFFIQT